jgi:hypothetical protein
MAIFGRFFADCKLFGIGARSWYAIYPLSDSGVLVSLDELSL